MIKVDYGNMPKSSSKIKFIIKFYVNIVRTWYFFNIKFPWIKYHGFIRVMKHTRFAPREITIGDRVQFGKYCSIAADVNFGSNILLAGRVSIVGRNDHMYDTPEQYIWDGARGEDGLTIVEDDVWIGYSATIIAGITIGKGSIIAAGSLVNKSIPPCEIWGGVPAKKIRNRFALEDEKLEHLIFLEMNSNVKVN